ncbi:MAG: 50S ribosomal protein L18 [Candidatus Omnitrophota bacterium]|jgi:large subunit ribosomal protein L18
MNKKEQSRSKRHNRIKMRMFGTMEKPRLVIKRSINNIAAQLIDDAQAKVIFAYSTANKEVKQKAGNGGNVKAASIFGELFAQKAKEKGVSRIIFDRAGYLYHGRVKAFADAARKGGLEF